MSEIDMTRTLPSGLEGMIVSGGILVLSVILVMVIVFMKRWHGRILPMCLGLMAYLIVTFIPSQLLISALSMVPSVDLAFEYNPQAYAIIDCGLVAVAGVLAKIVVGKMLTERYERQGDVYMAGLGVGLGQALLYGMTAISMYIWCVAINSDGLANVLAGVPAEEVAETYASMEVLFVAPAVIWFLYGVNAILDLFVHFVFTNVTYGVVKEQLPKKWYGISMAVSFVTLLSFNLYDEASLTNILIWLGVKFVLFAVAVYYTYHTAAKEIKYIED